MTVSRYRYALFDTAVGRCGVAWGGHGLVALQLPEVNDGETVLRLTERLPAALEEDSRPPVVQEAIDKIVALLNGAPSELSTIELDMTGVPPFHRRVYQLARTIPAGQTLSYGAVATQLGSPGAARAVGQALRRNPFAIVVPCHRVIGAGGKLGGFSANGGLNTKVQLLSLESPPPPAPDLAFDVALADKHLRAADVVLAALMDLVGPLGMQLTGAPTTFAALARSIVYQQLNGRSAGAIYGRLCALFPDSGTVLQPEDILAATDEQLLGAGLSRAKLLAIRDLARRTADGGVPTLVEARTMEDEAIVEELSEVRGIGRWSAEMFLIFTLGRPDVLPVGDFSVRKGFGRWFLEGAAPTPKELLVYGERWRPYRSVASWYLWQAAALVQEMPDR